MREPLAVGVPQGLQHLAGGAAGALDRESLLASQHLSERLARHERHHEPE